MDFLNVALRAVLSGRSEYRTRRYTGEWMPEAKAVMEASFARCGVPELEDSTFNNWTCDCFRYSDGRENYLLTRATWDRGGLKGETPEAVAAELERYYRRDQC
jgi:hypothetical protein